MWLLHVVPTYFPAVRYGGPIHSVHGLCAALAARGHDVHVFTTNVDGPGDSDVPLGQPIKKHPSSATMVALFWLLLGLLTVATGHANAHRRSTTGTGALSP
jgi:hypothetical protein